MRYNSKCDTIWYTFKKVKMKIDKIKNKIEL